MKLFNHHRLVCGLARFYGSVFALPFIMHYVLQVSSSHARFPLVPSDPDGITLDAGLLTEGLCGSFRQIAVVATILVILFFSAYQADSTTTIPIPGIRADDPPTIMVGQVSFTFAYGRLPEFHTVISYSHFSTIPYSRTC